MHVSSMHSCFSMIENTVTISLKHVNITHYMFAQLYSSHDRVAHKTCDLQSIVEDLRVKVFKNGHYLEKNYLVSTQLQLIQPDILKIPEEI
jgi:hypothetical protein